jgi:hypothetical protein
MAQIIGAHVAELQRAEPQGVDSQVFLPLLDAPLPSHPVVDMRPTRLLGFVSAATAGALQSALATVAGPTVAIQRGPELALLMQAEPKAAPAHRGRKMKPDCLQAVQKRLEIACQSGPFLAMDPATACCPTGIIPRLLGASWAALAGALAQHGARHQWDVIVHWPAQAIVDRPRAAHEAIVLAALEPVVLAFGPVSRSETESAITVLLPAGGGPVVEAALARLSQEMLVDFTFDMRGPLPPISFSAVRITKVGQGEVVRAWRRLDLPERIDASSLHWHWRLRAASAHADRKPTARAASADTEVTEITNAYHLLRDLLPQPGATLEEQTSLAHLLQRAGHRLLVPDDITQNDTLGTII